MEGDVETKDAEVGEGETSLDIPFGTLSARMLNTALVEKEPASCAPGNN